MNERVSRLIKSLIGEEKGGNSLSSLDICAQFALGDNDGEGVSTCINAAFLIALSGESHPLYNDAVQSLNNYGSHTKWGGMVHFYKEGLKLIDAEISDAYNNDSGFSARLDRLSEEADLKSISSVFFPEGLSISENRDKAVNDFRDKRKISITQLNPLPINDPAEEILFTSNVLITIPSASNLDELDLNSDLKEKLQEIINEEQAYWYDHPIPIGVAPENNEVLYGLEGLDRAVAFEKERGVVEHDTKLTCVLSVSVTHNGLQDIAKEYLEKELMKSDIRHLEIYVFTEADTKRLIDEILIPAAKRYLPDTEHDLLYDIFGVDGEYGRHYTFLKAVSVLWKVFVDPEVKGTFKIDLDQVFPQKELVEKSGSSAFEHLKTPLWGAHGTDSNGEEVELGMIAGALVNQDDIERSLYTPDVTFPEEDPKWDQTIFFSALPQALSTEAEMMTRYIDDELDGKNICIQRIHVTGGTNGILIDSLRRHRSFTPTFIGRAEDQAYILSVLFQEYDSHLRYVHKDGLIMRHDKEAFAADAIKAAAAGKLIGDYIRILYYSYYCRALPWSLEKIKKEIDPFTGCFVSKIPLTVIYLRFALKLASFFADGKDWQGLEFLKTGMKRLHKAISLLEQEPNPLIERYQKEKEGWDIYYNILDAVEKRISDNDGFMPELQEKVKAFVSDCRIEL